MKITLDLPDIDLNSAAGGFVKEWFQEIVADKSTNNTSPLRYADTVEFSA